MGEGAIQILCGGLGTLAYALFFHGPSPPSAPGHLGRCAVLAAVSSGAGPGRECISQCVGGLHGVCLWSEGMARVRKAPANIFMIPGIIPLLPGGALYYTMSALIGGDMDTVMLKGKRLD